MTDWIIAVTAAAVVVSLAVLAALWLLRRRVAVTPREWEELLLLNVLGGHHGIARGQACPDEREACLRSLDLRAFGAMVVASGALGTLVEAEDALAAAHERLMARGAATRIMPPDGMPPGSLPPTHIFVLTPRGAREAISVWHREALRVERMQAKVTA